MGTPPCCSPMLLSLMKGNTPAISYTPHEDKKDVMLKVQAHPTVRIYPPKMIKNQNQTVFCEVAGYYPEPIAIKLLVHGRPIGKSQREPDGTYRLVKAFSFVPQEKDDGVEFGCEVQHESLENRTLERVIMQVVDKQQDSLQQTAVVVISILFPSLIVAGVMAALLHWYHRRKALMASFMALGSPMPQHWVIGEEIALTCTAAGIHQGNIITKWFKTQDRKTVELKMDMDSISRGATQDEVRSRLLTSNPSASKYEIKIFGPFEEEEKVNLATILTFKPSVEDDDGVFFLCRFTDRVTRVSKEIKLQMCDLIGKSFHQQFCFDFFSLKHVIAW
ncbi:uncharacterized protein LOC102352653 [Latimeria chalumnae]|uniref:uncharacterized protein LOC102352653 n=1 Tax=Latimeria chalumnae TaxID=7897 RepID=UPI00313C2109